VLRNCAPAPEPSTAVPSLGRFVVAECAAVVRALILTAPALISPRGPRSSLATAACVIQVGPVHTHARSMHPRTRVPCSRAHTPAYPHAPRAGRAHGRKPRQRTSPAGVLVCFVSALYVCMVYDACCLPRVMHVACRCSSSCASPASLSGCPSSTCEPWRAPPKLGPSFGWLLLPSGRCSNCVRAHAYQCANMPLEIARSPIRVLALLLRLPADPSMSRRRAVPAP
jgi:hypothetical protein